MPNPADPTPTATVSTPSGPLVSVNIKRVNGNLELHVNAQNLHTVLRGYGAVTRLIDGKEKFENRPIPDFAGVISSGANKKISTEALLVAEYPAKFSLTNAWTGVPTLQNMQNLKASIKGALEKVLDHYQPVDFTLNYYGKSV